LIEIFDEWVRYDVGRTFVLNFDGALAGWLGMAGTLCIFGATCGLGMALEHNGDLYSCDHFVEPDYYLGNIMQTPLNELVGSENSTSSVRISAITCPVLVVNASICLPATANAPRTALRKRRMATGTEITFARATRLSSPMPIVLCKSWPIFCGKVTMQTAS
jgi:radical SAM protein with 4Fe4S-binding SPASM domain